jgi:transposase
MLELLVGISAVVGIASSIANIVNSYSEEQQAKAALAQAKAIQMQQVRENIKQAAVSFRYNYIAIQQKLEQARQQSLLEQYERYRQMLREVALHKVTQYAAGVQGGVARLAEIQTRLDADKDINVHKRNLANVAKQLGLTKEALEAEYNAALQQAALQMQAIEQATSWEELQLANQYAAYRTQMLGQALQSAVQAWSYFQSAGG